MDILEANFPQYFNRDRARDNPKPDTSRLPGDRGIANDALIESGDAVQCDEEYLEGLLGEMEYVELRAILWILDSPTYRGVPTEEDPEHHMEVAVSRLATINQEIRRLAKHPQLFKDAKAHKQFFGRAGEKLRSAKFLIEWKMGIDKTLDDWVEQRRAARSTKGPVEREIPQVHLPPWLSFNRPLPPSLFKAGGLAMLNVGVPNMEMSHASYLPPAAVSIARQWQEKVRDNVSVIASASKDPSRVQKMMPHDSQMLGTITAEGGKSALVKFTTPPLPETQTRDWFPWGSHDPAAASAQFMAMLEGRMTPETPAVWSALHRTAEGKLEKDERFPKDLGEDADHGENAEINEDKDPEWYPST